MHQGANCEPERVSEREFILEYLSLGVTWVRCLPLNRTESGHHKDGNGHNNVGGQDVKPDLYRQRVHETEQAGGNTVGNLP